MRIPIYLHKNAVALINIYTRYDSPDDLWITDHEAYKKDPETIAENAAQQFISQLEGQWTPRFLKALRREINKELEK